MWIVDHTTHTCRIWAVMDFDDGSGLGLWIVSGYLYNVVHDGL